MKYIYNIFMGFFLNLFKVIEENKQINVLKSLSKDFNGLVVVHIAPLGSDKSYSAYPHELINNSILKKQLRQPDLRILETIIFSEGDIFIISKNYNDKDIEVYELKSILDGQIWKLTENQIRSNTEITNRLNHRHTKNKLNL